MNGWVGIDLDGTLAEYDYWRGSEHIGAPIPLMVERVKRWLVEGKDVRILTARVSSNNPDREISFGVIRDWLIEHVGIELPVTAEKDYMMCECWDDRCIQVIPNTGIALQDTI